MILIICFYSVQLIHEIVITHLSVVQEEVIELNSLLSVSKKICKRPIYNNQFELNSTHKQTKMLPNIYIYKIKQQLYIYAPKSLLALQLNDATYK